MDFKIARNAMVEHQLRPNKISDPKIIRIFNEIPKEEYLKEELKEIAYCDVDIELIHNRGYIKNLHIAQLIQFSDIKIKDKILHIGGLTGYVTTILCKLSENVTVVENNKYLIKVLEKNLKNNNLINIEIIDRNFELGYREKLPYDLIFIDCPLLDISKEILNQLNSNNGKIIMIEKINNDLGRGVKISNINNNYNKEILFDTFSRFQLYDKKEEFVF